MNKLEKAAQDLLDVLAIAMPEVSRIIVMHTNRGGSYYGPNIRPQMDALEAALGAAPEPVIPKEEHVYISTACYHGLHDRCRQSCKFCSTPCQCSCGHKAGNVEAQLKGRE